MNHVFTLGDRTTYPDYFTWPVIQIRGWWSKIGEACKGRTVGLDGVQRYIIESCLGRGDFEQAEKMLRDWNILREPAAPPAPITKRDHIFKYNPGDHYYARGQKFDTREDAEIFLTALGFECLGLRIVDVFKLRRRDRPEEG